MTAQTEKQSAESAINQLLTLIVGNQHARQTDEFKNIPKSRVARCTQLAMSEYAEASSLLQDCVPDAKRMVSQVQRKIDGLNSLAALANVVAKMN